MRHVRGQNVCTIVDRVFNRDYPTATTTFSSTTTPLIFRIRVCPPGNFIDMVTKQIEGRKERKTGRGVADSTVERVTRGGEIFGSARDDTVSVFIEFSRAKRRSNSRLNPTKDAHNVEECSAPRCCLTNPVSNQK